jgi:hypothetical protein
MPVSQGQELQIKAADWNDLQSMLSQWRANRRSLAPSVSQLSGGVARHDILVQNTTANDIAAFGVLAISQTVIDFTVTANAHEKFNGIRVKGIAPSTSTPHYGKFCVLQEPAKKNGGFARAIASGPTWCKLSITHASDGAADIMNAVTEGLITGVAGTARIILKSSGTGSTNKWGLINLGDPILSGIGKVSGSPIVEDGTGTVAVWDDLFSGATGQTLSPCINHTSNDLAVDDKVSWQVNMPSGRIVVAPWKCS